MRRWIMLCSIVQPYCSLKHVCFGRHTAIDMLLADNRAYKSAEESESAVAPLLLDTAKDVGNEELDDLSSEDLSPDGPIAQRIRAEIAALQPLAESRFIVAPSNPSVGLGLFVASGTPSIEAFTYLFDYTGEILSTTEFHARYEAAGRRADYAVGIETAENSAVYIDAADSTLSNLGRYMNHNHLQPNVRASTVFAPQPRLMMFALKDLFPGDELVWDYGESYWADRDDLQHGSWTVKWDKR